MTQIILPFGEDGRRFEANLDEVFTREGRIVSAFVTTAAVPTITYDTRVARVFAKLAAVEQRRLG